MARMEFSRLTLISLALMAFFGTRAQLRPGKTPDYVRLVARERMERDAENYSEALRQARLKDWPLTIRGREGRMATLVGVDPAGMPMYFETQSNVVAAATIGTNRIWEGGASGFNLSGANPLLKNRLGIWDGGMINPTHVEFGNRVTMKDNNTGSGDGHATHVAGTLIASGVNALAKGMAYGIQGLIGYNFNGHIGEMLNESPGLYVSNHSYGAISGWRYNSDQSRWEWWGQPEQVEDYKFGYYSTETQMWDSIAYMSPNYLIVKSAGNNRNESGPSVGSTYWRLNSAGSMISAGARPDGISNQDGYDLLPTYSTAKNILTVGNVLPISGGYVKPGDVQLANSSSVGPTDDGRIKPDIVANGTSVTSTYIGSNNAYASLSGTSMSSPTVAGSAILLQEMYMRRTENIPAWSSTIRGLVIHTADEATGIPGPDYKFGWGLANFNRAATLLNDASENIVDQRILANGASYSINVVASGKTPLKATICWNDPPGDVNGNLPINDRAKKLVHDLDIRIKRGSRIHLPWKLDPLNPAFVATREDNTIDNVEVVELDSTVVGETYSIIVSHKGAISRSSGQSYTLIVSGVGGTAYSGSSPASTAGGRIDSVAIGSIAQGNPAGCKGYSDNRNVIGSVEVGMTAPFYAKVNSCDATDADKYVKVFIDFNNDGDFSDANETAATSGALRNGGEFSANISVPNTLTPGTLVLMRVVMQETGAAANVAPTGSYARGETQDYQLRIINPSNDLAPSAVVYPQAGECATTGQYVTVRIRNLGSQPKFNIPVSVDIKKGTTLVTTLRDTCKLVIPGLTDADYTLQKPFDMEAGAGYTFETRVDMAGDQLPANNVVQSTVQVSASGTAPANAEGVLCNGTNALLKATAPGTDTRLSWYGTPTGGTPLTLSTSGTLVNLTTITADKKYYVAANDLTGTVGPADKLAFPSGGYNEFNGNFVRFSNTIPMMIESARMYVANPGKVTIILADLASETGTGGYTYYPIATRSFDVMNTRPVAASGALNENNANDKGMVFNLNFQVSTPGSHILIMQCTNGATVFRNNNISSNPYPLRLNGNNDVFTITGNSVVAPSDPNNFYYFFYDMKVSPLAGCPSPRTTVTALPNATPTITQNGNVLTSSSDTLNQWLLNGVEISGANKKTFTATESGKYRVAVTDKLGCVGTSEEINVVVTSINNVDPARIGLTLSPNPSDGAFNLWFRVKGREELEIAVLNMAGQQVYARSHGRYSGEFSGRIELEGAAPGAYLLKITHGKDHYVRQVVVQ